MRVCKACNLEKPDSKFDKYRSTCFACRKALSRLNKVYGDISLTITRPVELEDMSPQCPHIVPIVDSRIECHSCGELKEPIRFMEGSKVCSQCRIKNARFN